MPLHIKVALPAFLLRLKALPKDSLVTGPVAGAVFLGGAFLSGGFVFLVLGVVLGTNFLSVFVLGVFLGFTVLLSISGPPSNGAALRSAGAEVLLGGVYLPDTLGVEPPLPDPINLALSPGLDLTGAVVDTLGLAGTFGVVVFLGVVVLRPTGGSFLSLTFLGRLSDLFGGFLRGTFTSGTLGAGAFFTLALLGSLFFGILLPP